MAEVSSHNAIWQVLDRVRANSPITGSEFGVALAALIFLRWADFEEAEREAIAAFDDVHYEPVLPAKFHWRSWCNTQDPGELEHIFRELPSALDRFSNSRHDAMATQLHRVAPAVEKLTRLPAETLGHLIAWLADQAFETPRDRRALREVLDSVLVKTAGKHSGEFFTPMEIAALMVNMVKPKFGESIYDPCFGTASLLTAALEVVEYSERVTLGNANYTSGSKDPLKVAGVELNPGMYVIGLTRLVLSGIADPQLELGSSLERVPSNNPDSEGFDIVLANPPWGGKVDLYGMDQYPIQTKDSSSLFIQHAISQLRPGGRAVIVVPPSILFGSGAQQRLREMLLEHHRVDAIVSLQRGAFMPYTSIESSLLMIRRGGRTKSVRMVDAGANTPKSKTAGEFLSPEEVVRLVRATQASKSCWDVDVDTLAQIDYDLTPKRRDRSGLELILDSLPAEAHLVKLKDCCKVTIGRNIRSTDLTQTPPKSNYEPSGLTLFPDVERADINPQRPFAFDDSPIPYIRIKDIQGGQATRGSSWLMPTIASTADSKWKLRAGDILFSKSGTIGKAGIVRHGAVGGIAASGFFVLRIKEGSIDPHYLLAYLQSNEVNIWLDDRAHGSGARHLSGSAIKELPVVILPLQIQRRVAEQHRKYGVDALTYLAELLSEDKGDSLAGALNDWVSHSLRKIEDVENGIRDLPPGGTLARIEEIARSECPLQHCAKCAQPYYLDFDNNHCRHPYNWPVREVCLACWLDTGPGSATIERLATYSPLVAWAFDFQEATSALHHISKIPDGVSVLNVLQSANNKLTMALEKLKGHLPNEDRARQLTNKLAILLESYADQLMADVGLDISVEHAVLHDGIADIQLAVFNKGALPLRDVTIDTLRWIGKSETIDYLDRHIGSSVAIHGELLLGDVSSLGLPLAWSAITLTGRRVDGSVDVVIDFESQVTEAAGVDLGPSPYVCGDPVKPEREDVFFGREELIEQIKRQVLQSGNVVLLEGNRRAGKSSVLWHLEGKRAIPGWLGVYCSLQGAEGNSDGQIPTADVFRGIAYEIVQSIRKLNGSVVMPDGTVLDGDKKLGIARALRQGISEEAPFQDFREYLELILETLAERQLGLLLMIDEFDNLQEGINNKVTSPQVPENIRFLVQSYPKFSAILTGSRRLKRMREEYWSALFGLGTRLGVSALPQEAAARLVTEPVAGRLSYSKSAVNRAYTLTAGQPYLLQCLCNRVFDIAARTGVRSITVDQVNDAANALVEDNEHFASLWDYTKFDRRRFLLYLLHREANGPDPMRLGVIEAKLEEAGVELREEVVISDLEYLRELELVDLHGESSGAYYTLTIPMMGQWLDSQQDYEVLRSRARAEAEDISGKLSEITRLQNDIEELEDSMDSNDE